jgi:hypothetical protein
MLKPKKEGTIERCLCMWFSSTCIWPSCVILNVLFCLSLEDQLEKVDKKVKLLQQQTSVEVELTILRESKSMKESEIRKV